MRPPNRISYVLAALLGGALIAGCSSTTPGELMQARSAYEHAASGPAAQYAPAQLDAAKGALAAAENQFKVDGDSDRTRDRAYVAVRKAQLAEAQARIAQADIVAATAERQVVLTQAQALAKAQSDLQNTQMQLGAAAGAAAELNDELARIGSVKKGPRGTVITLSGVLFETGQSTLMSEGTMKLKQLADALQKTDTQSKIEIDGYTDSTGAPDRNQTLSQKRADAVRQFLISQGIGSDRMVATGFGQSNPVASNATAEGRANNRRVEIVIEQPETNTKNVK